MSSLQLLSTKGTTTTPTPTESKTTGVVRQQQQRRPLSRFKLTTTLVGSVSICVGCLFYSFLVFYSTKISVQTTSTISPPPTSTSVVATIISKEIATTNNTAAATTTTSSSTANDNNVNNNNGNFDDNNDYASSGNTRLNRAVQNALQYGFPQRTKPIPQNRWKLLTYGNDNCFHSSSSPEVNRQYLTKQQKRKLNKLLQRKNNNTNTTTASNNSGYNNVDDDQSQQQSRQQQQQQQQQRDPYVMIIGAQKSGTSALASYLYQHPYAIKGTKEYHFFLDKIDDDLYTTIYYYDRHQKSYQHSSSNNDNRTTQQVGILSDLAYEEYYHILTSQPQKNDKIPDLHTTTTTTTTDINEPTSSSVVSTLSLYQKFMLDATPNYMFGSDRVPKRIMCIAPWVKIIVLLRNPIDRAYSQYNMNVARYIQQQQQQNQRQSDVDGSGSTTTSTISDADKKGYISFEEYIELDLAVLNATGVFQSKNIKEGVGHQEAQRQKQQDKAWSTYTKLGVNAPIGRGLYSIQLRHWLQEFRRSGKSIENDLLVLQTEQLKVDRNGTYMKVLQFLNLPLLELKEYPTILKGSSSYQHDDPTTSQSSSSVSSSSVSLPSATMSETARQKLQDIFEPYNSQLYNLLGKPEWKDVWK